MNELHPLFSKYGIMDFPFSPFKLARRYRASTCRRMPWTLIHSRPNIVLM